MPPVSGVVTKIAHQSNSVRYSSKGRETVGECLDSVARAELSLMQGRVVEDQRGSIFK